MKIALFHFPFLWVFLQALFLVCSGNPIFPFSSSTALTFAGPIENEITLNPAASRVEESAWTRFISGLFGKEPKNGLGETLLPKDTKSVMEDGQSVAPLVERLPERGKTTVDAISHFIEIVIDTFKRIIRDIKNSYHDFNDFYRLLFPKKEEIPLIPERPNTIIGNLQKLWDNRPMPIRDANNALQKKILRDKADALIQKRLAWLPSSLKGKTKNWLIENAPWLFDALCNGKTHINPRIQQLAADIQFKITQANPSVNNLVLESICFFKKSPI